MSARSGRCALVTGGSRGIGAAIVQRLATDGAKVAFTYAASPGPAHKLRSDIAARGGTALTIHADSADPAAVSAAVDSAVSKLGRLDILVNNAGVTKSGDVESFPTDEFERMLAVNVRAVFAAVQRAIPYLGPDGRIITIGSIFADHVPRPGSAIYAMTKGAVAGLPAGWPASWDPEGSPLTSCSRGQHRPTRIRIPVNSPMP
jgi:3-oxoacyl-[acyl-carrier protein] reductase